MARELRVAQAERRPARAAYANVPLTGHGVTLMPGYQLLEHLGTDYLVPHRGELPAQPDDHGRFLNSQWPDGNAATAEDLTRDAERWELAFAEGYRWLTAPAQVV